MMETIIEYSMTKDERIKQAIWDINQLEEAIIFEQEESDRKRREVVDKINSYRERIEELRKIVENS